MNFKLLQLITKNAMIRRKIVFESHEFFFGIYFSHYLKYPSAPFHKEMFQITEEQNNNTVVVMAFRGSAKSSIFTMSYPIWAILCKPQKKFVVVLGQTQRQARQHLANIKRELESNRLLKADLGPFKEIEEDWGATSLVISKSGARITAVSMEQAIRGMRHMQDRPDLIIADDLEDIATVKTKEGREKIYNWVTGEVVPAGDQDTKLVLIGNLLHEDSLLCRYREQIEKKDLVGRCLVVPLLDENENIAWIGKYPTMADVDKEKSRVANPIAWSREFELKIVPEEGRIIYPEWIKTYPELPAQAKESKFRSIQIGVDLAISTSTTADFTAMVGGCLYGYEPNFKIYVLPNSINKRLTMNDIIETAKMVSDSYKINGVPAKLFIEDVAFQKSVVQELARFGYPVQGISINFGNKRDRLAAISFLIQNGRIVFPEHGAENLIMQLNGFGVEKHDDLVDAFVILILGILGMDNKEHYMGVSVGNMNHIFTTEELQGRKPKSEKETKEEYYRRLQDFLDRGIIW